MAKLKCLIIKMIINLKPGLSSPSERRLRGEAVPIRITGI